MDISPQLMLRLTNEIRHQIFQDLAGDASGVAYKCAQDEVSETYISEAGERSSDRNEQYDILAVTNPLVAKVASMKSPIILEGLLWSVTNIRSRYDGELMQEDFRAAPDMRKLLVYLKQVCEAKLEYDTSGVTLLSFHELRELDFIFKELSKTHGKPKSVAVNGDGCYAMLYEGISETSWLGEEGIEVVFPHDVPLSRLKFWNKIVVEEKHGRELSRDTWMALRAKLFKVEENIRIQISDLQ